MIDPRYVAVVIPARDEQDTIGDLVVRARKYARWVVVADDSSTDGTYCRAVAAGANIISVPTSRVGMVDVYRAGLRYAFHHTPARVFIEMDAGGSHDPDEIPRLLKPMARSSVTLAVGCRFMPGGAYHGSLRRKLLSWGGTQAVNALHGTDWRDATSGFIGYSRAILDQLLGCHYRSTGHFYQTETRIKARDMGFHVVEVPITYRNSSTSLNAASIREAIRLVREL